MIQRFPAIISRPVAHDTEDTIPVRVEAYVDRLRDGELCFDQNAAVLADARGDGGILIYERGHVIRHQSFTELNLIELERAYRDNSVWDAADEAQCFPDYEKEAA